MFFKPDKGVKGKTMLTLTNSDVKSRYALNDQAVKDARNSALSLQRAAASGMYMLMHGTAGFINDLYQKLADEKTGSPKDAGALRVMFTDRVIDLFGKGGKRRDDDEHVWERRPTKFFDFRLKDAEGKFKGFHLIDVKNNTALTAQQIIDIKTARKEIREAGEDALNFVWKTKDAEERAAIAMDTAKMLQSAKTFLTNVAKNAPTNGMPKNNLSMIARAFGLPADTIGKVLEAYNDGVTVETEDDEEKVVIIDHEDEKPAPKMITQGKKKPPLEQAHA